MLAGHAEVRSRLVVPPAVRDRDDAGHDVVGHLDRDDDRAGARAHHRVLAVHQPEALGVVGVDVGGAALLAADEHRQVVHPRVVGAQVAAPDEHHAAVDRLGQRLVQARDVGDQHRGRELDLAARGAQHLGHARRQRAEVDAVRRRLEIGQRQPVGAAAQQQVEDPLGPDPRRDLGQELLGVAAVDGRVRVGGLAPPPSPARRSDRAPRRRRSAPGR